MRARCFLEGEICRTFVRDFVQQRIEHMKVVTSSEFRNNQRHYFEKSKKEGVVFVMRGGELYSLKPTTEIEIYYSNQRVQEDLDMAIEEIKKGESYEMMPSESLDELMARMRGDGNI